MKVTKHWAGTFTTVHLHTENKPYPYGSILPSAKFPQITVRFCIQLSLSTTQFSFSPVSGLSLHDSILQESFPTPLFLDALLLVQMARQGKSGAHQWVNLSLQTAVLRKAQVRCFTAIIMFLFKLQFHLAKHCFLLIIHGNLLILLLRSLLILDWI